MPPSTSHISGHLRQLIYYNLDTNLIRNALFIASRLHAYEPRSLEACYLFALCQLQSGQIKAAYEYSRNTGSRGTHLGCSYVYAQTCLELGKHLDGITALERSRGLWISRNHWGKHNETRRYHLPDAAAVFCLLGKLWYAHEDFTKAIECYAESLKLNPFMWDAFQGLCSTGANVRVPNIFKMTPELLTMMTSVSQEDASSQPGKTVTNAPLQSQSNPNTAFDPFTSVTPRSDPVPAYSDSALWERLNGSTVTVASAGMGSAYEGSETPTGQSNEPDEFRTGNAGSVNTSLEPPLAPSRKNKTISTMEMDYAMDPPPKMKSAGLRPRSKAKAEQGEYNSIQTDKEMLVAARIGDRKRTISGQVAHSLPLQLPEPGAPQRRSVRLFNQIKPSASKLVGTTLSVKDGRELKRLRATGAKGRAAASTNTGRTVGGNRKHVVDAQDSDCKDHRIGSSANVALHYGASKSAQAERPKEIEAISWLLELFSKLASGFFALSRFKCSDAIQVFNSLSQGQRETPWVLSQLGRAYYEQAMYAEAEKYFFRVKTMAPSRLDDMEIYSTVLWHLKNDVELAYLAHELMEVDRLSPQAWCATGNSFSHQRDHDQALKCFKRATQIDPSFAYAFTLQGHEYVANEEYDKALEAYRHGISADSRHYNAWYGLGTVYEKMGKFEFAEQHFRNAASINPTNAVLVCCIGLVLEKMDNPRAALVQYGRACALAPHSVLARFRKARALMKVHELKLALTELKILKDMAPDEANVHYLLGKLYKLLRDRANAIKHFTSALNLDPKAAQYIKDAMESLDDDEYDDDEEMA